MSHKNVWSAKKYHPVVCERLLEVFIMGGTVAQFCKQQDMGVSNFYKWLQKYPEFKETFEKAKMFKLAYHESELKTNLENQAINTTVFKYYMRLVVGIEDKPDVVVNNNNQADPVILEEIKAFREKFKSDY